MKETEIQGTKMNRIPPEAPSTIQRYLRLKYPIEIVEEDDGVVASIPDLPGCVSFGDTIQKAVENLKSTKELWIKGRVESGQSVPEPSQVEDFSGKFVLRVPRGLHRSLDREAKRQGVSLNQYILHLVSERHAVSKLESFVRQTAPLALASGVHGGLDWPEEGIPTSFVFVHTSTSLKPRESVLSMIDHIRKPMKQFSKVVKQSELPTTLCEG